MTLDATSNIMYHLISSLANIQLYVVAERSHKHKPDHRTKYRFYTCIYMHTDTVSIPLKFSLHIRIACLSNLRTS